MLRKLAILASMSLVGLGSANAATLFMPAVSGIPDKLHANSLAGNENGCIADIPAGRMAVQAYPTLPYNDCFMTFPINLPVGTTIDGVEIAYRDDSGANGRSIIAVLASNRVNPYMGTRPLGVASDNSVSPVSQQLFANMGQLSVPMLNGDVFWVQVSSHRVTEIDYVAVTYH
jgi:hypothetical protein